MHNGRRMARATALTAGALALVGGLAVAASPAYAGPGTKPSVKGTVTSVNGDSTPGVCGTSDNNGTFVVSIPSNASPPVQVDTTVTVTPGTSGTQFAEHKVVGPTFANVCVGDVTTVIGTNVDHAMTAQAVAISIPKANHLFGLVTSVNGDSTQRACGTAGADGVFTVVTVIASTPTDMTVYVNGLTVFAQKHVPDASFANVCVGLQADASGPSADGAMVAYQVTVKVPKPIKAKGTVNAVNGDSTPGVCGVAGTTGGFDVSETARGVSLNQPVAVSTATTFADAEGPGAVVRRVCVGTRVMVIGNSSSGTLNADAVAAYPPKA